MESTKMEVIAYENIHDYAFWRPKDKRAVVKAITKAYNQALEDGFVLAEKMLKGFSEADKTMFPMMIIRAETMQDFIEQLDKLKK